MSMHGLGTMRPDKPGFAAVQSPSSSGEENDGDWGCAYYGGPGGDDRAPFDFNRGLQNGSSLEVVPVADPGGSGLCVFPRASCASNSHSCCRIAGWVGSATTLSGNIATYGSLLILVPTMFAYAMWVRKVRSDEGIGNEHWMSHFLRLLGATVGITAQVFSLTFMASSTQLRLGVADRNAMLAADTVLTLFQDAFQFFEDTLVVTIAFSIGRGAMSNAALLFKVGLVGGALLGSVAAGMATALTFWPAAMRFLLGAAASEYSNGGCSLVPSPDVIVNVALRFWILRAWNWPFHFVGLCASGLLLAHREYVIWGITVAVSKVILIFWWSHGDSSLDSLAYANFASGVTFSVMAVMLCFLHPSFQPFLIPTFQGMDGTLPPLNEQSDQDNPPHTVMSWQDAAYQGIRPMVFELCIQFGLVLGIYVTVFMGVGPMYHISALQAAMPTYATALSQGLGYMAKLLGGALIGRGNLEAFVQLASGITLLTFALAILAVSAAAPFHVSLAFHYASPACVYASRSTCAGVYTSVFGGGLQDQATLQGAFIAFGPAAAALVCLNVFKSCIYACLDFGFLLKAGVVTFTALTLPFIFCARLLLNTPLAIFGAMYVPVLALALACFMRLREHMSTMSLGKSGPWSALLCSPASPPLPTPDAASSNQ